ncbi:MAG: hypothetical protein PHN18_04955 [Sulfurospirillaceae bacterium]|jgi:uncharacterized membrane protein|nr:hypothetical protein [Sulfurospirillaceae bacterium]MDD2825657.1 hypothetical protein [Sulfurospirillaceae bacterium]
MLILLPFVLIIVIIAVINHVYYPDVAPKNTTPPTVVQQGLSDTNKTNNYLDKYIKK